MVSIIYYDQLKVDNRTRTPNSAVQFHQSINPNNGQEMRLERNRERERERERIDEQNMGETEILTGISFKKMYLRS